LGRCNRTNMTSKGRHWLRCFIWEAGSVNNESAYQVQFNNAATISGRFQSTHQDYSQNHGTGEGWINRKALYVHPNGLSNSNRAGNQRRGGRGRGGRGRGYEGNQINHHGSGSDQPQHCTYCDMTNLVTDDCKTKKRRWQSGWWVGNLSSKLMRGKDLIKKHKKTPPFFKSTRGLRES
jgi:hypothetical protein